MNFDQVMGIIRAIVPPMLSYAAGAGLIPGDAAGPIMAAISAVAAAVWSVMVHTDSAKIAAAAALPEVAKIVAVPAPEPGGAVAAAVAERKQPFDKVTGAVPSPAQRT